MATVAAGAVVLGLVNIWWLAMNIVSFAITQAPITFQRLRGDEGVHFRDANLVSFRDVVPAIAFAAAALAVLPVCLLVVRRLARALSARTAGGTVALAVVLAAVAYSTDVFVFRDHNFGVADHPAFNLLSSFVHGYVDEHRSLEKSVQPENVSLRDLQGARTPIPETEPPPRGRAEMKNVIVIFSEGIALEHTSLAGTGATPHLEQRFHQSGLEVTRYHSPFHKSIAAIYSYVCSDIPPPSGTNIVEINPRIDCGEMSDVLSAQGIHTGLFHGGDFGFYDKLGLLGMRGYEVMEDAKVMSDPGRYDENGWGIDDRAMVDALFEWVDAMPPAERFAATLIPFTAHYPYWFPEDAEVAFPDGGSKARFLSAVHFLDEVFEKLMQGLEARGLDKDTAVIFLADHGETVGEPPRASAGRRLAYEPSLHVPFVIMAPGMWPGGSTTNRLTSHVDLLPTILDLLGLPPDPRHHGTSILQPDRPAERLFIAANNGPRWVGWLDGEQKIVINRTTGAREAYDLAADPDERHNIIAGLDPAWADSLERDALAFADGKAAEIAHAPKRDKELDLQTELLKALTVRVHHDGQTVECTATGGAPAFPKACGGSPPSAGRAVSACAPRARARLRRRRHADHGWVELEVPNPQRWFPLFARVRVGLTGKRRDVEGTVARVAVSVDGVLQNEADVTQAEGRRISFPAPRESVVFRVEGDGTGAMERDVCLTFTDRAWRGKTGPDDDDAD